MEPSPFRHKGKRSCPRRHSSLINLGMSEARILTFYLHDSLRRRAEAGRHNFINKLCNVVREAGFSVAFTGPKQEQLTLSVSRPGYAMFHMADPFHDRALTMRKVYEYPFWAIETTAKRWDWQVARSSFPAEKADRKEAQRFYKFWQNRQFGPAAAQVKKQGFVYVPLQGRLLQHRSFQCCSPLRMVEQVLEQDRTRPVVATLHPKETYSAEELAALEQLEKRFPRLTVRIGGMAGLLAGCDYVVTQNSSAAFFGYFFAKPAVLFGQIDFHHIAANVIQDGAAAALEMGPHLQPDFAGYVHWFWQQMSINGGLDTAEEKIRNRLKAAGWPV